MNGAICPRCGGNRSEVRDSRAVKGGVRRNRECRGCFHRFTTVEIVVGSTHKGRSVVGRVSDKMGRDTAKRLLKDAADKL